MKRIVLISLALIGIVLILSGTIFAGISAKAYLQAPEEAWSHQSGYGMYFEWTGMGYLGGFALGLVGAILALIGGLISKPRFMGYPFIIAGLVYCLPLIIGLPYMTYKEHSYPALYPDSLNITSLLISLIFLLPGISAIVEGFVVRSVKIKSEK
jgi:hypothetical protein